jgi:hypothetical protein
MTSMIRRITVAGAAGILILTGFAAAAAQRRPGSIVGVVMDSTGAPIANVEISAPAAVRVTRSDTSGRFVLTDLPPGKSDISFRRVAYSPVVLVIEVASSDTVEVEVTLGATVQQLTGVVVEAKPEQLRKLVAFEARRRQGIGTFITRAQIEDRHPMRLSEMLRLVPSVALVPAENGRTAVRFTRGTRSNCPPQYVIDGVQATGFSIDDVPPGDVEGVELYAGSAGVPPEYNRLFGTSICGTVIIWTRIPGAAKAKP